MPLAQSVYLPTVKASPKVLHPPCDCKGSYTVRMAFKGCIQTLILGDRNITKGGQQTKTYRCFITYREEYIQYLMQILQIQRHALTPQQWPCADPRYKGKRSQKHIRCFKIELQEKAQEFIKNAGKRDFFRGKIGLSPFDCSLLLILSFVCKR